MDFLSLLDSVKEDVLIKRHPLADEELSLRFAYSVGVGMSATADGSLNEMEQAALKDLAAGLLIPAEQTNKVLATASKPDKANITDLLGALTRREQQYLFLLDLRAMANRDGGVSETEQKTIEQFAALFKMSGADLALWRKLEEAVFAENFEVSEKLFQEAYQGKDAGETGAASLAPYRALAYFWRSEAIRDELAAIERGIAGLKEERETAVAELRDIGERPKARKYGSWGGQRCYEDNRRIGSGVFTIAFEFQGPFNEIDDSAGEYWDELVTKRNQIIDLISVAESRRDSLAAAIDGMYVGNIA